LVEEPLQVGDDLTAVFVTGGEAVIGRQASYAILNRIEAGDARQRLGRYRWGARLRKLVEPPANMGPVERQGDVAAPGERAVAGIAVDLQHALEPCQA